MNEWNSINNNLGASFSLISFAEYESPNDISIAQHLMEQKIVIGNAEKTFECLDLHASAQKTENKTAFCSPNFDDLAQ